MHAAPILAEDRLRHERGVNAVLTGDFLDGRSVGHHLVGHPQGLVVAEIDFVLAGRHLVVRVFHPDPQVLQREDRLAAQVRGPVDGEAVEVPTLVEDFRPLLVLKIEKLQLRPHEIGVALVGDLLDRPLQDIAGIPLIGGPVRVQDITDHSGHRPIGRPPGDHLKGRRIGHGDHVALLNARKSLDRRPVEAHSLLDALFQLRGRDAENLLHPQDIREPELHEADIVILHRLQDILLCLALKHGEPLFLSFFHL